MDNPIILRLKHAHMHMRTARRTDITIKTISKKRAQACMHMQKHEHTQIGHTDRHTDTEHHEDT